MTRFLLLAALFVAAPAFAQSHADALARFAPFYGSYDLDGMNEGGGTFTGTLDIDPILGGQFVEWTWVMRTENQEPIHLGFLTTYDSEASNYTIWRFDSRDLAAGSLMELGAQGWLRFDGDALVMGWPVSNPGDPSETGQFQNEVRSSANGIEVLTDVHINDGAEIMHMARTLATRR